MQEAATIPESGQAASIPTGWGLRRSLVAAALLLAVPVAVLSVPLINVNRFQRRIVRSLSESLGRPIHLDRISLILLPFPGLTIDNLVVGEDPAFGAEPFVRAGKVRATLRFSSLWRRRVEFSRISFAEPSINLVHSPDGKWNLESILLQAARIEAAPTAQARASAAPRFPYIEATGARLNLKQGQEKTPLSLTEADFALWLHSPQEWRLRLDGKPMRTDTSLSETGTLQMEGTLGRAAALSEVPIDLKAVWRNIPLGEASRMVLGRDAGLRGTMTLSAGAQGTIGKSAVLTVLHLTDVRRADFVPAQPLSVDAECQAIQSSSFHALTDLRCSWPASNATGKKTLALTGTIPDVRQPASTSLELGTPGIPAATLLKWLRIASPRIPSDVSAAGSLTGSALLQPGPGTDGGWSGEFMLEDGSLTMPSVSSEPIFEGDLMLRSVPAKSGQPTQFVMPSIPLALGGRDFATLDARFGASGYTLHLMGTADPAKLRAFGAAFPQIGDGLTDALPSAEVTSPVRIDLTSVRTLTGPRVWQPSGAASAASTGRQTKRRRKR